MYVLLLRPFPTIMKKERLEVRDLKKKNRIDVTGLRDPVTTYLHPSPVRSRTRTKIVKR